jgi:hypothetical protein
MPRYVFDADGGCGLPNYPVSGTVLPPKNPYVYVSLCKYELYSVTLARLTPSGHANSHTTREAARLVVPRG